MSLWLYYYNIHFLSQELVKESTGEGCMSEPTFTFNFVIPEFMLTPL